MNPRHLNIFFKRLQLRELDNKGNLQLSRGNIFRDYHFREFGAGGLELAELGITNCKITDLVVAECIICVIYNSTHLVPFTRNGEISACKDDGGKLIVNRWDGDIVFACYNNINKSLLTVVSAEGMTRITSTEIESIISGRNTERCTQLFPHESVKYWNFDIANCRGMVCMAREREWRVFELSKYRQLFKIPYNESHTLCFQGEIDLLLYEVISRGYPGVERFFKIYCKLSGQLKKQFSLPGSQFDCITSCGRDRLLIQPPYPECMQIVDISSDIPRLIKTTVCSFGRAFCLNKSSQFICKAKIDNSNKYDVENPQGESSGSVTSKYGVHVFNLEGERSVTLKDFPHSSLIRYIPRNEDVAIFLTLL